MTIIMLPVVRRCSTSKTVIRSTITGRAASINHLKGQMMLKMLLKIISLIKCLPLCLWLRNDKASIHKQVEGCTDHIHIEGDQRQDDEWEDWVGNDSEYDCDWQYQFSSDKLLPTNTLSSIVSLLLSSSYPDRKCPGHGLDTSEKWLQCVSGQVTLHDHLHQIILIIHTWTHVRVFLVINKGGAKYNIENNEYRDHDLCF